MKKILLPLTLVVMLASCASPIERRMTRNPDLYQKLPESQKVDVKMGRVTEGMGKDAVFLAWGRPARVQTGQRNGKPLERWSYNDYQPVYTQSFGFYSGFGPGCGPFGGPFGGGGFWGGPSLDYVPVEGRSVEFVGGKVVGFTTPAR